MEPELEKIDAELKSLLLQLPNIPFDDVPVGKDDSENVVLRKLVILQNLYFTNQKIIWSLGKIWI